MKKRSIGVMILLALVTFGFYPVYWQCSFQNQLKKVTGKGFGGFGHFVMCLVTFGVYSLYWSYAAGKRLTAAGAKDDRSALYLILNLVGFGWLNMFLMQAQANGLN